MHPQLPPSFLSLFTFPSPFQSLSSPLTLNSLPPLSPRSSPSSSWVLASINIRRITQGLGTYNPIDPSLVVLGVITFIYFLAILARGRSGAFKTSMVIGISTLLMLWYLANAIAYTVKRYSAPKYCQASVRVRFSSTCP
jgi:hypothetical protein